MAGPEKGWNNNASMEYDPSLLTGNAGILYFLLKYKKIQPK
jgi:hypothetical protein